MPGHGLPVSAAPPQKRREDSLRPPRRDLWLLPRAGQGSQQVPTASPCLPPLHLVSKTHYPPALPPPGPPSTPGSPSAPTQSQGRRGPGCRPGTPFLKELLRSTEASPPQASLAGGGGVAGGWGRSEGTDVQTFTAYMLGGRTEPLNGGQVASDCRGREFSPACGHRDGGRGRRDPPWGSQPGAPQGIPWHAWQPSGRTGKGCVIVLSLCLPRGVSV